MAKNQTRSTWAALIEYLPKQMGEDQLDDPGLDGPITLRILDGIA